MNKIFDKRGLIVSCQALLGEPLYGNGIMAKMALAAAQAGAVGIRTNGNDISKIKEKTGLPIIGINKRVIPNSEIYITPTLEDIKQVVKMGADLVAFDFTNRENRYFIVEEFIEYVHNAGLYVVADISTLEEGIMAEKLGADFIATTLSGYTPYSPQKKEPDFKLISDCSKQLQVPVIAEGRIKSPKDAVKALKMGADYVVVGGAITRPQLIAADFVSALNQYVM